MKHQGLKPYDYRFSFLLRAIGSFEIPYYTLQKSPPEFYLQLSIGLITQLLEPLMSPSRNHHSAPHNDHHDKPLRGNACRARPSEIPPSPAPRPPSPLKWRSGGNLPWAAAVLGGALGERFSAMMVELVGYPSSKWIRYPSSPLGCSPSRVQRYNP